MEENERMKKREPAETDQEMEEIKRELENLLKDSASIRRLTLL